MREQSVGIEHVFMIEQESGQHGSIRSPPLFFSNGWVPAGNTAAVMT